MLMFFIAAYAIYNYLFHSRGDTQVFPYLVNDSIRTMKLT